MLLTAAALLLVLAILGGLLDQTELSLHPFYRRRLAMAFDARQVVRHEGYSVAVGYPYAEMTSLSSYAKEVDGFPEVIFAAAANLVGEQRAPLSAASFTFSSKWMGGPDIGYMQTQDIERAVAENLRRDMTVEAAVADRHRGAVRDGPSVSLVWDGAGLTGTAWHLAAQSALRRTLGRGANKDLWHFTGIPRIRRLTYLLREIFGNPSITSAAADHRRWPLREPRSGGVAAPTAHQILASMPAVTALRPPARWPMRSLAQVELGVKITLRDSVWDMVPGSVSTPLKPDGPLASLNARYRRSQSSSAKSGIHQRACQRRSSPRARQPTALRPKEHRRTKCRSGSSLSQRRF